MYWPCLSTISSSFSIFLFELTISIFIPSINSCFSCRSCSYLPDLLVMKSIDLLKDLNQIFSLIWLSFVFLHICRTFSISSSNFCYTQFIEFAIKLSKLNSLRLFESSQSLDLRLKSRFLLSKIFVIPIILKIF